MEPTYQREREAAVRAVRAAARLCRRVQQSLSADVLEKRDRSPVTVADFGSQALVCRELESAFGPDPIIGEEDSAALRSAEGAALLERVVAEVSESLGEAVPSKRVTGWIDRGGHREASGRHWTLDPLDGTKGFLRGDQYAIALGLVVDGRVVAGALAAPNLPLDPGRPDGPRGVVFHAVLDQGAVQESLDEKTADGTARGERRPLSVSAERDPARFRLCEPFESGHGDQGWVGRVAGELGIRGESRRLDSLVKYAVVARGEAEVYLRLPRSEDYREKVWDHAAGVLVLTESGGAVTDVAGRALDFGHGATLAENRGVIASHGPVHGELVEAVRALSAEGGGAVKLRLSHLDELEAEAIHVFREVVAEAERPVLLYSVGKDSSVLIQLAKKAFHPGRLPFPLLHVDTTFKFQEMYEFRDRLAREIDAELIVSTQQDALKMGLNPWEYGTTKCCALWKTRGLLDGLGAGQYDAAFGGARRDEERSRAKERIYSFRDRNGQWDPKSQRPELWNLYNGRVNPGESMRVFPLSNWTEIDVWSYIHRERIPVVPLYFARERDVAVKNGQLIPLDSRLPLPADAKVERVTCRFRSLGCVPCTGAVRSEADTIPKIIEELAKERHSERATRVIDHDRDGSMELKKREGYF